MNLEYRRRIMRKVSSPELGKPNSSHRDPSQDLAALVGPIGAAARKKGHEKESTA
jgi:hypothetical protein